MTQFVSLFYNIKSVTPQKLHWSVQNCHHWPLRKVKENKAQNIIHHSVLFNFESGIYSCVNFKMQGCFPLIRSIQFIHLLSLGKYPKAFLWKKSEKHCQREKGMKYTWECGVVERVKVESKYKRLSTGRGLFRHGEQCTQQALHSFSAERYEMTNNSLHCRSWNGNISERKCGD